MKIFYYSKPKSALPYNMEHVEVNPEDAKSVLKSVLEEYEGQEYAEVCIYDVDLKDKGTLFEYFQKYLNLAVFQVTLVDPKKIYSLPNALEFNVHLNITNSKAMGIANEFKKQNPENCKIHLIDEYRYIAITHPDGPVKQ